MGKDVNLYIKDNQSSVYAGKLEWYTVSIRPRLTTQMTRKARCLEGEAKFNASAPNPMSLYYNQIFSCKVYATVYGLLLSILFRPRLLVVIRRQVPNGASFQTRLPTA